MKKLILISVLSLATFSILSKAYDKKSAEVVSAATERHKIIAGY